MSGHAFFFSTKPDINQKQPYHKQKQISNKKGEHESKVYRHSEKMSFIGSAH